MPTKLNNIKPPEKRVKEERIKKQIVNLLKPKPNMAFSVEEICDHLGYDYDREELQLTSFYLVSGHLRTIVNVFEDCGIKSPIKWKKGLFKNRVTTFYWWDDEGKEKWIKE